MTGDSRNSCPWLVLSNKHSLTLTVSGRGCKRGCRLRRHFFFIAKSVPPRYAVSVSRTVPILFLCVLLALAAQGQQPILDLAGNGVLSWTNSNTNARFSLEWAPRLDGQWTPWDAYQRSPVTSQTMSVEVPMFFRLSVNTNVSKFVPPDGKVLVMIGQDTNNIDRYVDSNWITPGGIMIYTSVQNAEGITNRFEDGGGPQWGQYLADRYTNSVIQIGLYMVGELLNVLIGDHDANIDFLGNWMAGTHRPVYLRIGYEFDADWTAYDPLLYQDVFRYIVDRYTAAGISNVSYVWHSQAAPVRTNLMAWYPGDRYVDWVAASVFGSPSGPNRSNLVAVADLARELKKPFMIAEASPHGIGVAGGALSWGAWYDPTFEFIRDYDVRAFCYINCNWDGAEMWQFNGNGWGDARVQANSDVQTLWQTKMAYTNFLHASTNLFGLLGF